MARKTYATEQIIGILREVEVRLAQGEKASAICRSLSISEQSYYRWRREYGGLKLDQAKRLKDLERENARLRNSLPEAGNLAHTEPPILLALVVYLGVTLR